MLTDKGFAKTRKIPSGAVLATCIGSVGKMGMAVQDMSTNQQINSIVPNDDTDNQFAYYAIQSRFPRYVSLADTQVMPIISKSSFSELILGRPSIDEQRKIGEALDIIDCRIDIQSKLIDRLSSLIDGFRKTMLSKATTTIPISQIDPNITAGSDKDNGGNIPLYGSTGIIGNVSAATYNEELVLVARVGSIGTIQYVNEPCGVSDNTLIIRAQKLSKYIYQVLKQFNFKRITSGTTQPLITASSLKKIDIPFFTEDRMKSIETLLSETEVLLSLERHRMSLYNRQKQYLLQQMFV